MPGAAPIRNKGRRSVQVLIPARRGEIELNRPYFWGQGQGGVCPAEEPVGIEQGHTSPGAREILCRLGMVQDFGQAADDARRIGNIPVCKEKLRQIAEREAANITRGRNDGTIRAAWTSADAQVKTDPGAPRLTRVYAGVDGVMAPIVTAAEKEKRRKNQVIRRQQRLQTGIGNARELPPARPGADEGFKEMKIGLFYDQDKESRRAGSIRAGGRKHLADRRGQMDRQPDLPDAAADQSDAAGLLSSEPARA